MIPQLSLPVLSARALGRFRIAVGLCLLAVVGAQPLAVLPEPLHRNYSPLADNAFVHWLASSEPGWTMVHRLTLAALALFTIGLRTRTAYALALVGIFLTCLAHLQSHGVHDWDAPMVILLALSIVPWGDGVSLDQRLKPAAERIPPQHVSSLYGFAVWIPGLVLGLAFAAAAFSKMWESGPAWITTGAVKYHFIEDAPAAPVSWGLWVAAHHPVAVAASAASLMAEAGLILLAVSRQPALRGAAAVVGVGLFSGFYLFQGVLWWPWIMWLLALLPWDGWRSLGSSPLRPLPVFVTGLLVAAQAIASLGRIEIEPVLSSFTMYAGTYASPAEYESSRRRKYQRVHAQIGKAWVDVEGDASDHVQEAASSVANGRPLTQDVAETVQRLCSAAGPDQDVLTISVEQIRLDWTTPLVERRSTSYSAKVPCGP